MDAYRFAQADEKMHTGDYYVGCGISYGAGSPEAMHRWEYEHLEAHPDRSKDWISTSAGLSFLF